MGSAESLAIPLSCSIDSDSVCLQQRCGPLKMPRKAAQPSVCLAWYQELLWSYTAVLK